MFKLDFKLQISSVALNTTVCVWQGQLCIKPALITLPY